MIRSLNNKTPQYGKNCFFAETAVLIGDVVMGDDCSIWYSAVLRGDVNAIKLGNKVNVQDGVVIHGTYKKSATTIGDNVSIAHNATIHGCNIQHNVLIGMNAVILDNVTIQPNSIVAAGAVVTKGTLIESGSIYGGIPAKKIKDISKELIANEIERIAESYLMYSKWYTK